MKILNIENNEQQWLDIRKELITSTDIAALFGVSKYSTPYKLYHQKVTKQISTEVPDNNAMFWGRELEESVAHGIAKKEDWNIEPYKVFIYDEKKKIGASFDFIKLDGEDKTILEIKTTNSFVYRETYDTDNFECPYEYELQVQLQMHLSGIHKAIIAVFVLDKREYYLFYREYDAELCALIEQKVIELFTGSEPDIDFSADYNTAKESATLEQELKTLDGDDKCRLISLVQERAQITEQEKELKKRKKEIESELFFICGDAKKTIADNVIVSIIEQKRKGKLITEDMVGTYLGESEPYKVLRVKIK